LVNVLTEYKDFIASLKEKDHDEVDEEEEERVQEETVQQEDAVASVADIIGSLVKFHGPLVLPLLTPIVNIISEFIKPTARLAERHVAVCIIDDIVQYGGKEATNLIAQVISFYFNYVRDPDPAIRQAVAYGIGMFALKGEHVFAPYVPEALTRLIDACNAPDARTEEFLSPTDNAASAIGNICAAYGQHIDLSQILPTWLHILPARDDTIEALVIYNNLCNFVENPATSSKILGLSYEHLPKTVAVLVEAIGTDFVDENLTRRMTTILKGLHGLPQEIQQKTWAVLSPESQAKLQQLVASQ